MEENKKKRGRPVVGKAKKNQFRIMLTDEELEKLKYCGEKTNRTLSDIVREGMNNNLDSLIREVESGMDDEYSDFYDGLYDIDEEYDD